MQPLSITTVPFPARSEGLDFFVSINAEPLKTAGLWRFVRRVWGGELQSEDLVKEFITNSCYGDLEEFTLDGQPFQLTEETVGKLLHLPSTGRRFTTIGKLKPDRMANIFDRTPKTSAGCVLARASNHWGPWLKFVNQHFFFNTKQAHMSEQKVAAGVFAWEGVEINWADVVLQNLRAELRGKRNRNPLVLGCALYIDALCSGFGSHGWRAVNRILPGLHSIRENRAASPEDGSPDGQPARKRSRKAHHPQAAAAVLAPTATTIAQTVFPPPKSKSGSSPSRPPRAPRTPTDSEEGLGTGSDAPTAVPAAGGSGSTPSSARRSHGTPKGARRIRMKSTSDGAAVQREAALRALLQEEKAKWTNEKEVLRKEFAEVQTAASAAQDRLTAENKAMGDELRAARQQLQERDRVVRSHDITTSATVSGQDPPRTSGSGSGLEPGFKGDPGDAFGDLGGPTPPPPREGSGLGCSGCAGERERALHRVEEELGTGSKEKGNAVSRGTDPGPSDPDRHDAAEREPVLLAEARLRELAASNDDLQGKLDELQGKLDELHGASERLGEENGSLVRQAQHLKEKCWEFELRSPPSFSLFRAYELQREVCREVLSLHAGEIHSHAEMDDIWMAATQFEGMHDLLCEMVVRGDLLLTTHGLGVGVRKGSGSRSSGDSGDERTAVVAYWGSRALLYNLGLEHRLSNRRASDVPAEHIRPIGTRKPKRPGVVRADRPEAEAAANPQPAEGVSQAHQNKNGPADELRADWKQRAERLHARLTEAGLVQSTARCVQERERVAQRGELTLSQYVYNIELAQVQLVRQLHGLGSSSGVDDTGSMGSAETAARDSGSRAAEVALLASPPPTFVPAAPGLVRFAVGGSAANQRFLGNYEALFRSPGEMPLPSWAAMDWLLEDYGYEREEAISWDVAYRTLEGDYQVEPPAAVALDGHFCRQCRRRCKWDPKATIDSVEYNWPEIPGSFDTPAHCAEAYDGFFDIHRSHTDPVCFRAAVFCKFLAYFCRGHRVLCNVNEFSILRPEIHILIKLQYRCARWTRMVEVMATTHFFFGGHSCLVNEFTNRERGYQNEHGTRLRAIENFLDVQRKQNYQAAMEDDDVRKELHGQDRRRFQRDLRRADEQRNRGRPRVITQHHPNLGFS